MPASYTLESFIAMVEANEHVRAIEQYYAPDASMQENDAPPRRGRELLAAHEAKVLGKRTRIEELAYQRWDGEKVMEEKFFYDPAQFQARP